MSLSGQATAGAVLRGKIKGADVIYYDAYRIAVQNGFEGTVDEWLDSIGNKQIVQFESLTEEQKAELKGEDGYTPQKGVDYFDGKDGEDGENGYTPVKGTDYFTEAEKEEMASEAASKVTAKDVTSKVSITSMGQAVNVRKATDNGNTIVIHGYGSASEMSISVSDHPGSYVGGYVSYYDEYDNQASSFHLGKNIGTPFSESPIDFYDGGGEGDLCIVLFYV